MYKKIISTLLSVAITLSGGLLIAPQAKAANRGQVSGFCQTGNPLLSQSGNPTPGALPGGQVGVNIPACTVTVTNAYTGAVVKLFSNNTAYGTTLANPFTVSANTVPFSFFVDDGVYNVAVSGNFTSQGETRTGVGQGQVVVSNGASPLYNNGAVNIVTLPAQTAITTVTTIQTMGSFPALPAGVLNVVGKSVRICGGYQYTQGGSAATLTVSLLVGGITPIAIASTASTASAGPNNGNFCYTVTTAATGATGTLEAHGWYAVSLGATGTATATYFTDTNTAVSSAIDLTAAPTFSIALTASTTVTTATLRYATLEFLN